MSGALTVALAPGWYFPRSSNSANTSPSVAGSSTVRWLWAAFQACSTRKGKAGEAVNRSGVPTAGTKKLLQASGLVVPGSTRSGPHVARPS